MSEFSIQAARVAMSHKAFRDELPDFDVLTIETQDRHGTKDLVRVFLDGDVSERLARAVAAFNEAWEKAEAVS